METQVILTIPQPCLDRLMRGFAGWHRGQYGASAVGRFVRPGRLELLYHSAVFARGLDAAVQRIVSRGLDPLVIMDGRQPPDRRQSEAVLSAMEHSGVKRGALLCLRTAGGNVTAFGWVKTEEGPLPVDVVNVPGPGMLKIAAAQLWPAERKEPRPDDAQPSADAPGEEGPTWLDTRDRLAGFLGRGEKGAGQEMMRAIASCEITVVGAGRAGDCAVSHLVKLGAGKIARLNIIDKDFLLAPNLDSMEAPYQAVGRNKAEVLAAKYSWLEPGLNVNPIPHNVSDAEAAEAIARSDLVFSCLGNNAGRTGVAVLAQLYNRVHFDFSGGGVRTRGGHFSAGGEVRCGLPGSRPCVACMKENNWEADFDVLDRTEDEEVNDRLHEKWEGSKAGSCKAIISSVVGNGMLMVAALFRGELRWSMHQHFDANSIRPAWPDWTWRARRRSCRVCGKDGLAGLGDTGVEYVGPEKESSLEAVRE
jgi:molybdopterin/thiamine biosynthesis adenylyltransferase